MTTARPPEPSSAELAAFYEALGIGRANARTAQQIATAMNIPGRDADRYLRNLAQHSVQAGLIVCSGNAGYWRPATAKEVYETIGRLRSQGLLMLERARHLQALADVEFVGQGKLF